jgi:hypothetical protein
MAYQTGSVANTFALYDRFEAWLTGSTGPGWNLQSTTAHDTAGTGITDARDKVFFSSGSDGQKSLMYRATFFNPTNMNNSSNNQGITASIGTKRPAAVHNVFDYIVFRGYLNWKLNDTSTNGGSSSFGTYGPAIYQNPRQGQYPYTPSPITVFNYSSSVGKFNPIEQNDETQRNYQKTGNSGEGMDQAIFGWFDNTSWIGPNCSGYWDDRRRNYYCSDWRQNIGSADNWSSFQQGYLNIGCYDLANGNNQPFMTGSGIRGPFTSGYPDYQQRGGVLVYNSASQEEFMYFFSYNETNFWKKANLKTNIITDLTNPGLGAKNDRGFKFVWDGNDTIYKFGHYNTAEFEKYSINGNSWTTLSSLPAAIYWLYDNSGCEGVYIPHSASQATLTNSAGAPTDVIYMARGNSQDDFYRYDVSNDNWVTDVLMPSNWEERKDKLWWDGSERLWFHDHSAGSISYRNISSSTDYGTWTTIQSSLGTSPYSGSQDCQLWPLDGACSKIRGQPQAGAAIYGSMNYWFQGDEDTINIVTETSGNFYWAHFGAYDSLIDSASMKTTATATAGTNVTISVDDTAGRQVGQQVLMADVSGSNTIEKNHILEVVSSTSIKVGNLSNNMSSGSFIGLDPNPALVTGDSFLAVSSLDANGYRSDEMASMYRVIPSIPYQLLRSSKTNTLGTAMPWPLIVYNNTQNLSTYQAKGVLKNCWVMVSSSGYPGVMAGSNINVQGSTYKAFGLEETTTLMGNNIDRLFLLIKTT